MLFHAIFTLTLFALATATPTPGVKSKPGKNDTCTTGKFNAPWIVRDIFMWQPLSAATSTNTTDTNKTDTPEDVKGSINFIFIDPNEDLQMMTECESELINGATPDPNGGYMACKNKDIWFQFHKDGNLILERFYLDPCLGSPPWDGSKVAGSHETGIVSRPIEGFGLVGIKTKVLVNITLIG